MVGVTAQPIRKAPTCPSLAFTRVDLAGSGGLDDLRLVAVGQGLAGGVALVEREVADPVPWCPRCGCRGKSFGSVARRLAHVPFGTRPTAALVRAGTLQKLDMPGVLA